MTISLSKADISAAVDLAERTGYPCEIWLTLRCEQRLIDRKSRMDGHQFPGYVRLATVEATGETICGRNVTLA